MGKKKLLGWKPPYNTDHQRLWAYSALVPRTATRVEKVLKVNKNYISKYDQGSEGACVGFGSSWMMSILNRRYYDARWLWNMAKEVDIWPDTNPGDQNGTTVMAAMDILRGLGHVRVVGQRRYRPNKKEGILENRWAENVDQIRTAISKGTPVTIGVKWYNNMDSPELISGDYWIAKNGLGRHERNRGHCVCIIGASDERQAVKIINSWGTNYPQSWLPYRYLQRLLNEDGEAAIVTDRP
ncbi:MAG: hypothetical protein IT289_11150 [Oligoflexia bacterium]|nr:hypothetical protein [Oligoflexia bacterium]